MLSHAEYDIEADVETRVPYSPDYSYSSDDTEHETTPSAPRGVIPIHLIIKTMDERRNSFYLTMTSSLNTVAMLRKHPTMLERFGEESSSVTLVYAGKTLLDTQTMEDIDVPPNEGTIHAIARTVQAGPKAAASEGSSCITKGKRKINVQTGAESAASGSSSKGMRKIDAKTTTPVTIFIKAQNGLVDRVFKMEMESLMDTIGKVRTHHLLKYWLQGWASKAELIFQGQILKDDDTLAHIGVAPYGSCIYAVP